VPREQTTGLGILKVDGSGRIVAFEEKPPVERLDALESDIPGYGKGFLASMGIYLFSRQALEQAISDPALVDFGRHVIPRAIRETRVHAHVFHGYWEDVGTIGSYFDANLALTDSLPPFNVYDAQHPFYTHPRLLPASKIEDCVLRRSLLSEGCILLGADIERSVVGIRSRVGTGSHLKSTLMLGADWYESLEEIDADRSRGVPPVGVGEHTVIERAILDKNVRVGSGVRITNHLGRPDLDGPGYYVRDGIVIIPKGGIVADGTTI
jgi:glucose-1-phosphate adenylyltransferase